MPGAVTILDLLPTYPVAYIHLLPFSPFLVAEPDTLIEPVFFNGWENLSTKLAPDSPYSSEDLYGGVHNWPYYFHPLVPILFESDGTSAFPPTSVELFGNGRVSIEVF